jgi:hypothetical protein
MSRSVSISRSSSQIFSELSIIVLLSNLKGPEMLKSLSVSSNAGPNSSSEIEMTLRSDLEDCFSLS